MARRKPTPERSTLQRERTTAFARRQRTNSDGDAQGANDGDADAKPEVSSPAVDAKPENRPSDSATNMPPVAATAAEGDAAPIVIEATTSSTAGATDETPAPRARAETIVMPREAIFGQPPALPDAAAAVAATKPAATGGVEDPTFMPAPRNIPDGNPDDPAPAPGHVPRGDSRSFRRGEEFALIYRIQTFVVSRVGNVGKRGVWRVVEYPTTSSAANSYARECSRWLSDGYADFR